MGDFIEGPIVGRYIDHTPYRVPLPSERGRSREGERGRGGPIWLMIGCLVTGALLTQGVILFEDRSNAEKSFSELVDGRCYVTSVGAKGLVESSNARAKTVTMIFQSGLRETYSMSNLSEAPCASVSDNASTRHQGGE
ncbi:hypothetical protein D3C71_153240 [compost metagenome]